MVPSRFPPNLEKICWEMWKRIAGQTHTQTYTHRNSRIYSKIVRCRYPSQMLTSIKITFVLHYKLTSPCPPRALQRFGDEIVCQRCKKVYEYALLAHAFIHILNNNFWEYVVYSHQIWRESVQRWANIYMCPCLICACLHMRAWCVNIESTLAM
jgi:hypothetical protein